jgi:hypothetical protein
MDVFSISSIRKAISVIFNNIGNKGKISISDSNDGNVIEKVLDKSDKVKVSGVLLKGGDKDGTSSWFSKTFKGKPNRSGEIVPSAMQGLYDGSRISSHISSNENLSLYIKLKSRVY